MAVRQDDSSIIREDHDNQELVEVSIIVTKSMANQIIPMIEAQDISVEVREASIVTQIARIKCSTCTHSKGNERRNECDNHCPKSTK